MKQISLPGLVVSVGCSAVVTVLVGRDEEGLGFSISMTSSLDMGLRGSEEVPYNIKDQL